MSKIPIPNASSITSAGSKGVGGIFTFLWRYKYLIFTLGALVVVLLAGIQESIQERSLEPLVVEFGGRVFLIDRGIGLTIEEAQVSGSTGSLGFLFKLSGEIWLLFVFIKGLAWLVARSPVSNESETFRNYFIAIILLYFFTSTFCLYYNDKFDMEEKDCFKFFKGTRKVFEIDITENGFINKTKSYLDARFTKEELPVGLNKTLNNLTLNLSNSTI